MEPMKKALISLILIGVVIAAGYLTYVTYVSGDYEDGAPQPTIIIKLTEVNTDESNAITLSPTRDINAFTTINAQIFAVKPTRTYKLEFITTYHVTPPAGLPAGTQLEGSAVLYGYKPTAPNTVFFNSALGYTVAGTHLQTLPTSLNNYTGVAEFTAAKGLVFDRSYEIASPNMPILGSQLGGTNWILNCTVSTLYAGTGAYYGTTQVTINMVLAGENLTVSATGVAVTVSTP